MTKHWSNGLLAVLPDVVGKDILVIVPAGPRTIAAQEWPQVLWDRGVRSVTVFGGVADLHDPQLHRDHRVNYFTWDSRPPAGEFDIVLCSDAFGVWRSHQLRADDRIWQWLASRVRPHGVLIWTDTPATEGVRRECWESVRPLFTSLHVAQYENHGRETWVLTGRVFPKAEPRVVAAANLPTPAVLPILGSPVPQVAAASRATTHAMILGGASCVWDDVLALEALYGRPWDGLVVACNDIGSHWPRRLDHWVTLHAERLVGWQEVRKKYGHPNGYVTWGRKWQNRTDRFLKPWAGGASGMYAAQVAYELGCRTVVLCGIPMTGTPHFSESLVHRDGQPWNAVAGHWRAWELHHNKLEGWCRSMSGRTQQLLSAPTREWLGA